MAVTRDDAALFAQWISNAAKLLETELDNPATSHNKNHLQYRLDEISYWWWFVQDYVNEMEDENGDDRDNDNRPAA